VRIALIGAGVMAEAIISSLLASTLAEPKDVVASDVAASRLASLEKGYGISTASDNREAAQGADVVVMIHPDYQYDSALTGELVRPILQGRFDIMLGSRIRTRAESAKGGMPLYKYFSNRFLTLLENLVLGQNLSEYHTGFRAYSRQILSRLPFHRYSDDFVFDQQILLGAIAAGARIGEIPVPVRYFPEASSINFRHAAVYGLSILRDLTLHLLTSGKRFLR